MKLVRKHQLKHFVLHLVGLILADARLQCEKMFVPDFVGLLQHLPPSVLAGRFGAKHGKLVHRKHGIMVLVNTGKDKIGPRPVFGYLSLRKSKPVAIEYFRKVVLERKADS